jgi:transcriptional regulator with XRE-family HTH domain
MDDPQEFGRRVSAARSYAGWSQPEFAEKMGYKKARSTTERWERGDLGKRRNNPDGRSDTATKVIAVTGCPPAFFDLSEPEPAAVDQLKNEFEQKLVEQKNELRAEAAKEREVLEARLLSIESAVRKLK